MSAELDDRAADSDDEPLLAVENLEKHFPVNTGMLDSIRFDPNARPVPFRLDDSRVRAVDGVSFDLRPGETLGVVGESGCGKSTLARTILQLEEITDGTIRFDGVPVSELADEQEFRKRVQMVFQDPQSSLNARRKVGEIITDPLEGAGWPADERRRRALELLEQVGLEREYYNRYPHEFSGGQRQRINLARALSINPDLVVCDEPVSGLDVSVQAQILDLMDDLQTEYGLTYLFISHDLSVVRYVADRVAVMYLGEFVEVAPADRMFADPQHPYTQALLASVPNPNPERPGVRSALSGDVPSATHPPRGCRFHTRCPEFILPDGFDSAAYTSFDELLGDLRDGGLDVTGDAETVVTAYFDDPAVVPTEVRQAIDDAVDAVGRGDREAALEHLAPFESICQRESPIIVAPDGTNHAVACHLKREDVGHGD